VVDSDEEDAAKAACDVTPLPIADDRGERAAEGGAPAEEAEEAAKTENAATAEPMQADPTEPENAVAGATPEEAAPGAPAVDAEGTPEAEAAMQVEEGKPAASKGSTSAAAEGSEGEGEEEEAEDDEQEDEAPEGGAPGSSASAPRKAGAPKAGKTGGKAAVGATAAKIAYHKYDVAGAATWSAGKPVPYLFLARVFGRIEAESKRLLIIEMMANALRTVIATSPGELLPFMALAVNKLAPAFENVELGIGDSIMIKAVAETCGRSVAAIKTDMESVGDLGEVAMASRTKQVSAARVGSRAP
jgi:DNA ligase-1